MKAQEFKEIQTNRLMLKPLVATFDFANHLFDIISNNREFFKYMPWADIKNAEQEFDWLRSAESNWKNHKSAEYGMFLRDTNDFIGVCSFFNISWSNEIGEIGYWLNPKYANNGFMSEAITAISQEYFNNGFKRIIIRANIKNIASYKTAEKCGFTREGIMKSATFNSSLNEREDIALYAKIKED